MKKFILALILIAAVKMPAQSCAGMSLGNLANLNGFVPFPATNVWNTNIANAPVDPASATIVAASGFAGISHLHHDFSNTQDGPSAGVGYGIPYVVVDSSTQPFVPIAINAYAAEGDLANEPIPANAPIEESPGNCVDNGDQHMIIIDRNTCMMYETWNTVYCNGKYTADSETIWDLKNYENRPWTWTSADAAGLPVFAGLVRYDEVASGAINHAIRFTLPQTRADANDGYMVNPATHAAGTNWSTQNIIGMRIRLKASFDISKFSATNQVILKAMQQYGLILADNGSYFYWQGTPDPRWDDGDLSTLDNAVSSADFDVVQMTPAWPGYDNSTVPTGAAPTISSFTASALSVSAGTPVTLTWSTTNDSYNFIDKLGGVNGNSVTFTPTATGTYTLNATNAYGRTTAQVTVTVGGSSTPPPPSCTVNSVSVTCTPSAITTGQTSSCAATVSDTGTCNNSVTWAASNGTISGGVYSPSGAGTANITAVSVQDTTKSGTSTVTVTAPAPSSSITSVKVSCSPTSITTSQTSTCTATVSGTGSFSKTVTWSSAGGSVSSSGVLTPTAAVAGADTATATSSQDSTKSGSATVTVTVSAPTNYANHALCTLSDNVSIGHCTSRDSSTGTCTCK